MLEWRHRSGLVGNADARKLTPSHKVGASSVRRLKMGSPWTTSRDRRKNILESARVLFWKKGYPGTSMVDLANACACKPANLYNYFKTKEEILFEVLLEEMEQII